MTDEQKDLQTFAKIAGLIDEVKCERTAGNLNLVLACYAVGLQTECMAALMPLFFKCQSIAQTKQN